MNDVPFVAFEGALSRLERTIKRLFIVIILLIVLLVGTNALWIWYESQFEDEVVTTVEAEADTGTAIANLSGDVNYCGESKGNSN